MSGSKEPVEFFAEVRHRTENALLLFDGAAEFWIPKSQILTQEKMDTHNWRFEIPQWLAEAKEIV